MDDFGGFEPWVGAVRAVRTFRVGPGGVLYSLFSDTAWSPGMNSAVCRASALTLREQDHHAPDADCTCGFYAYAGKFAAGEYANARDVLAVVSCFGRVIAGTQGLRAQYARIEAIWMSPSVPPDLASLVEARYADSAVILEERAMFARFAPTVLDCYEPLAHGTDDARGRVVCAVLVAALIVGGLPVRWLSGNHAVLLAWLLELCCLVLVLIIRGATRDDAAGRRHRLFLLGAVVWTVSPWAGAAGIVLLKLPLILIAAFGLLQRRQLIRSARQFPADIGPAAAARPPSR